MDVIVHCDKTKILPHYHNFNGHIYLSIFQMNQANLEDQN